MSSSAGVSSTLSPLSAEQLQPTAFSSGSGDSTLATMGQPVVMLTYGATPLGTVSSTKLACFSVANLLRVVNRPGKKDDELEFVLVDLPNRPKPYSLDSLAKSGNGLIDQPLCIANFTHKKSRRLNRVEMQYPSGDLPQIREGRLIGWVTTSKQDHPTGYEEEIPPLTLIPTLAVYEQTIQLTLVGPRCRFHGRVEIPKANGKPRVTGMPGDSLTLRYVFPEQSRQFVYPICPSQQAYTVPGIPWSVLCSCTHELPLEDIDPQKMLF